MKALKLNKRLYTKALAVIGVIGILAVYLATRNKTDVLSEPAVNVQFVYPRITAVEDSLSTVGIIEAKRTLTLYAPNQGKIAKIYAPSGTEVQEGTPLLAMVSLPDIKATFAGHLDEWHVKEGEFVAAGTNLNQIFDLSNLKVSYNLPEYLATRLALGQQVAIVINNERVAISKIDFIAPTIDKHTHTIAIKASLDNLSSQLLPGMTVNVAHIFAIIDNSLVIPESPLQLEIDGYSVFLINEENKVKKQTVRIGSRNNGYIHVLTGISKESKVILVNVPSLREGSLVNAQEYIEGP